MSTQLKFNPLAPVGLDLVRKKEVVLPDDASILVGFKMEGPSGLDETSGFMPGIGDYRIVGGVATYPVFAARRPEFVDGLDLVTPRYLNGMFSRNLNGGAGNEGEEQGYALKDHQHIVKTNSATSGESAGNNNPRAGWNGEIWDSSPGVGAQGVVNADVDTDENRPANAAYQWYFILDNFPLFTGGGGGTDSDIANDNYQAWLTAGNTGTFEQYIAEIGDEVEDWTTNQF